jgi:hypothetical protein
VTLETYRAAVLHLFTKLADTPPHPRGPDRRLAAALFAHGVPIETVKAAFLLATARRATSAAARSQPLPPIRSLHYFLPVIREIQARPLDPAYLEMLMDRLRQPSQPNSSNDTTTPNGGEIRR